MRTELVNKLTVGDLRHVLTPFKRPPRMQKDYVDVGFDSEFTVEEEEREFKCADKSDKRELLSIQFSLGKGRSAIYYINKIEGISGEELLNYALKFLAEQNVVPPKHIFLIAHFAQAELSKVNDFYTKYVNNKGHLIFPTLKQFNKAVEWIREYPEHTLHINDLFGHMKTSLEKIGLSVGIKKVTLDEDGKDHAYWIVRMKELLLKHPEKYEEYAICDAEIAITAWNKIVEEYQPLHLDPHIYPTFSSITMAHFRSVMTKLPCPMFESEILSKQRAKNAEWREHISKVRCFDGDLRVRIMACESYWGGNNQSFIRGYLNGIDGYHYDFISLYIIAAILQPLSNELTTYKPLTISDIKDGAEGFAQVNFNFPSDEKYPSLPVHEAYRDTTMFPTSGKSFCTINELRQALEYGVKLDNFRGYGFYAGENEINSELRPFLAEMLKKKSGYDLTGYKGIERDLEKAKMVGIVGKFAYMKGKSCEDLADLLYEADLDLDAFRLYSKRKAMRELTERTEVGNSWHVEWASLILGKARTMANWAIHQGEKCLSISTDGGFWLGNAHLETSDYAKALEKYYSGIRLEGRFSELFIVRNRGYVAWKSDGTVQHSAGMGLAFDGGDRDEKQKNFEFMVRKGVIDGREIQDKDGKEIIEEFKMKRLTGVNDFLYDKWPLNSQIYRKTKIKWETDYKRIILNPSVKIFQDWSDSKPYNTVRDSFKMKWGIKDKAGRPKRVGLPHSGKLSPEDIAEIIKSDLTVRALGIKYGVSGQYISKIKSLRAN